MQVLNWIRMKPDGTAFHAGGACLVRLVFFVTAYFALAKAGGTSNGLKGFSIHVFGKHPFKSHLDTPLGNIIR